MLRILNFPQINEKRKNISKTLFENMFYFQFSRNRKRFIFIKANLKTNNALHFKYFLKINFTVFNYSFFIFLVI